jgi:predicted phosphoribosyltransferase
MFADLVDAGQSVVRAVLTQTVDLHLTNPTVIGITAQSMPIVRLIANAFEGSSTVIIDIDSESGAVTGELPRIDTGDVIVTAVGVETGRAVLNVYTWLQAGGHRLIVLAVPVCPREVETDLARRYDRVIAVDRPLGRRSLRWHYAVPLE